MGIRADIQSLSPSALIELFELDMSVTTSGGKLYFHAGTNGLSQPIVWQGVSYEPWPIKASGFDKSGQGTLPRPKIQVSNYDGVISAELQANDDLIGCKIIRKMTLARFLDAVNFPDGTRPQTQVSISLMKCGSSNRRPWRHTSMSNSSCPAS